MRFVRAFDRLLTAAVNGLLVLLFLAMLCLSAVQIGARYLFGTGIPWTDIVARNLVLWVGLCGAILATGEGKHFQLDVLTRFLPPRSKSWFNVLAGLFASGVCLFLLHASIRFLEIGLMGEGAAFLSLSLSTVAAIIPVAFGLMAVQFLLRSLESLHRAVWGNYPGEEERP